VLAKCIEEDDQTDGESPDSVTVYTIGHSTRSIEEFEEILHRHMIKVIVDVRTIPRSRHNPQFNQAELKTSLEASKIGYVHIHGLGGLRHTRKDSPNMGWRNLSFRGFADYMQTKQFKEGLLRLMQLAKKGRIALMCAEAVPWRCHRSLISDALKVRGVNVVHIMSLTQSRAHVLTPWIKVEDTNITYPYVRDLE
jgi:uncharacterized protein (DUF488 family)